MENFEIHNRTIYCKTLDKLLSLLDSYIYDINPLYEGIKVSRVKHTVLLTDDNVTDFWKYTLTYDRGLKLTKNNLLTTKSSPDIILNIFLINNKK